MGKRPIVGADPVPAIASDSARGKPTIPGFTAGGNPPQQIGVTDCTSFVTLLTTTFYRLNGLISDPQDMIQLMEAEILRLRRGDANRGPGDPSAENEVVSHTQDSKDCPPQQPTQQEKKLYYVRLTLEEADGAMQPSPVNFPTEVLLMRLGGPLHKDSARCTYGDLDSLLEKLGDGSI